MATRTSTLNGYDTDRYPQYRPMASQRRPDGIDVRAAYTDEDEVLHKGSSLHDTPQILHFLDYLCDDMNYEMDREVHNYFTHDDAKTWLVQDSGEMQFLTDYQPAQILLHDFLDGFGAGVARDNSQPSRQPRYRAAGLPGRPLKSGWARGAAPRVGAPVRGVGRGGRGGGQIGLAIPEAHDPETKLFLRFQDTTGNDHSAMCDNLISLIRARPRRLTLCDTSANPEPSDWWHEEVLGVNGEYEGFRRVWRDLNGNRVP